MTECINRVSMTGTPEKIMEISTKLEKSFSMSSLIPLEVNENSPYEDVILDKIYFWGCEEDMDVKTYIHCNFEPYKIDMIYTTDSPNTTFLRRVSSLNIDIEHTYYNEEEQYVGMNNISLGEIVKSKYSEDVNGVKELAIELGFADEEESSDIVKSQVIISMKDILDLNK